MSTGEAQQQQQWPQADYMNAVEVFKLLKSLFYKETPNASVEKAFKFFEANFLTQPNLISVLIDYYFMYGINSTLNDGSTSGANFSYNMNVTSNSKSIIDLICLIPDSMCNKLFDKILEFMNKFPMHQPQQQNQIQQPPSDPSNSSPASLNHTNFFERVTNLLILLCYRQKNWLDKLPSHQLLNNVIRILKSNSNQTELITVHSCLLFVLLINSQSSQMFNQHAESLYQIFINLFKYQCSLENKGSAVNELVLSSVKWSIRLYFYVCYGFNGNQLMQYLKKKDSMILAKESFMKILFYLRMNPSLLKDKSDSDKISSKQTSEDQSIEWRRFCLDPLCTNYNQVIQNMQQPIHSCDSESLSVLNNFYSHNNNNMHEYKHTTPITSNSVHSNNEQINNLLVLQNEHGLNSQLLLSPSYLFTSNNEQNQTVQPQQSSIQATKNQTAFAYPPPPYTDNLLMSNIEPINSLPINNPLQNSTIKNLTTQFMMNDTSSNCNITNEYQFPNEKFHMNLASFNNKISSFKNLKLSKLKSKSDTNLYYESSNENRLPKSIPFQKLKDTLKIIPPQLMHSNKLDAEAYLRSTPYNQGASAFDRRLTSFDISDLKKSQTNTNKSAAKLDNFILSLSSSLVTSDIKQKSINISPQNESTDVIRTYFKNMNLVKSDIESATNTSHVSKLKEEINHLVVQLIYERHLREKYEEDANRLHFIQIERDQLLIEKQFSEKKLKQLVEQYKNEVEVSLSSQKNLELNAYKEELKEKNNLIGDLQTKLDDNCKDIKDLRTKFDDLKQEHKKIEKECAEAVQTLEKEQNIKTKYEIDYQYMNSLKHTTDIMRKKLLLMSKSQFNLKLHHQQQMQISYNQDLIDIAQLYNSSSLSVKSATFNEHNQYLNDSNNDNQSIKADLSLYCNQQSTIDSLKIEVEQLQSNYDDLLVTHNANAVELENCKRNLVLKDIKLEELNQSIQMDSIEMNAEIMKNQYRVYSSLMNVNKRLEEEILKLRAHLNEKTLKHNKLEKKHNDQAREIQQLLIHMKTSTKEGTLNNIPLGES